MRRLPCRHLARKACQTPNKTAIDTGGLFRARARSNAYSYDDGQVEALGFSQASGTSGARHAGLWALMLLALTAVAVWVLAIRYHLTGATVVVAIVGAVPSLAALYLAYVVVPRPVGWFGRGRRASRWNPVELGVHQAINGGAMPTYVLRPHDALLRAVLDPAVSSSRLVVVRGGSSTGKSRAAYEAVLARFSRWKLDFPANPAALSARLEAGIPAGTVLWLGELRDYADVDGGPAVLGRLDEYLQSRGLIVITTLWPEHWSAYNEAMRVGLGRPDPTGVVGRLLERLPELTGRDPARIDPASGGIIDVPERFTDAELEIAVASGDPVLAAAAAEAADAGQDGQMTQYLAAVPELVNRYRGVGGDPYGQAVIAAAMDAVRFGHASPLSAVLLQKAGVGYLTSAQRTEDIASWRDRALTWATAELRGAVRALQPVPPPRGTGVIGYRVADYLEQLGASDRRQEIGPPSLWEALTEHATSVSDLTRLGQIARAGRLYRHAANLWTKAAGLGGTDAAFELVLHLLRIDSGDAVRAAEWVAGRVSLDDPRPLPTFCGRCGKQGLATPSPAYWPVLPATTSASTVCGPSPLCCRSYAWPEPAKRMRPSPPGPAIKCDLMIRSD